MHPPIESLAKCADNRAGAMLGLTKYVAASTFATGLVVWHAFSTRNQFFPAMLHLSQSKIAIAVGGNFAFALCLCTYKMMIKVFLGSLREAEVERINDRISQAIMETCLAMTIFREEFNVEFCAMFTILTFVKVFHWLVQDRVDYMETTPATSRLQHLRIVTFMAVLLAIDLAFLQYTVGKTLQRSASVHLLFAFEYVIQASIVASTAIKYGLGVVDNLMEGRWESKGMYVFYLELVTDMLHLLVYVIFFIIVFTNYGLPLHLVRDLYWTFRNFRNRVTDFLRYRRVTANMDERFREASAEDLARCDGVCIICREEMAATTRNKCLPCGHVFHLHCLRSWLERQQNCPICRTSVFAAAPGASAAAAEPQRADAQPAAQEAPLPAADGGAPAEPPPGRVRYWRVRQGAHHAANEQHDHGPWGDAHAAAAGAGHAQGPGQQPAWPAGGYGYVWNIPQWYPHTSMALFAPAAAGFHPLQYAGQQLPNFQHQPQQVLPMLPLVLPPALQAMIPPPPANASPEQIRNHHTAAAAAAAAAASVMAPYSHHMLMPPTIVPMTMSVQHQGAAPVGAEGVSQEAAAAAANAAAAAAAAAVLGSPPGSLPHSSSRTQALRQQMDILQAQLSALQALQTTAPQPSLPEHLRTQPANCVPEVQPAGDVQLASEAARSVSAPTSASGAATEPPSTSAAESQASASESEATSQGQSACTAAPAQDSPEEQMRKQRLQRFAASE